MQETNNFSEILTDQLIDMRAEARMVKDYALADQLRNELDSRLCFVFDAADNEQVVYHLVEEWFELYPQHKDFPSRRVFVEKQRKWLDIDFQY